MKKYLVIQIFNILFKIRIDKTIKKSAQKALSKLFIRKPVFRMDLLQAVLHI